MKWKHSRDHLAKNKYCGAIVDKRTVFCICGQKVSLDNDYDDSRLNEHSKNSRCKVNNKKRQLGLPGLFSVLPNPKKSKDSPLSPSLPSSPPSLTLLSIKPCPGLSSEQITSYISQTSITYKDTQWREIIGKEIFPNRFSNETGFSIKKLKGEERTQFNYQVISESEWFIDRV
ncbi:15621_t:CDS:1, partial [Dentiscutata erythropus]